MSKNYPEREDNIYDFAVLEPEATYSYADYLKWQFEERVELIKGKIFKMSPAPRTRHQEIHSNLFVDLGSYFRKKDCKIFSAPFDVRFPNNPTDSDAQTFTVVQPDICIVCDKSKLDVAGCKGAPDLIIEILSPSTSSKDLRNKYELYEEHGVKEYWVVYPGESVIEIFELSDSGKYTSKGKFLGNDIISTPLFPDLILKLEEVFIED